MKKYFGKDLKRMNHALKVARYAEQILKMEGGNPLVVLGAAYLHDIGIHEAERKCEDMGALPALTRRQEGPAIAREILERLDVKEEMIEEICDIIGHHHHPRDEEETLNFQILYEADWLVNIEERGTGPGSARGPALIDQSFRTEVRPAHR